MGKQYPNLVKELKYVKMCSLEFNMQSHIIFMKKKIGLTKPLYKYIYQDTYFHPS